MDSIQKISKNEFPRELLEIPDPPKQLYVRGSLPPPEMRVLCVVGAREHTPYGAEVCDKLISGLAGKNIVVVSGLALGIDGIAHKAALKYGLKTYAIPGSGLDEESLYPTTHRFLARDIIKAGGGLISEFEPDFKATSWGFPQRNRIMAGLSHAIIIIEAEKKSGTLITARLGLDYNREVLAVPGSIFSKKSEGPNFLLSLGAAPARASADVLQALGFAEEVIEKPGTGAAFQKRDDCSEKENKILELLAESVTGSLAKENLVELSQFSPSEVNILVSLLEMKGRIIQTLGLIKPQ